MRAMLLISLGLCLSGCATAPSVTLEHPTTHQKVTCDGASYYFLDSAQGQVIQIRQGRCISDYQRQGYERVPN